MGWSRHRLINSTWVLFSLKLNFISSGVFFVTGGKGSVDGEVVITPESFLEN